MRWRFLIDETPLPKKRHRMSFINGKVRSYDPQSKEKNASRLQIVEQLRRVGIQKPLTEPLSIKAIFYMGPPASWSAVKQREASWWHHYSKKPDCDNLCKYILDCLNGLLYADDCQIVQLCAMKRFGKARTEVEVHMMDDYKPIEPVSQILSVFGPDDLREFSADVWELLELHCDGKFDELDLLGDEEGMKHLRNMIMEKSACHLSRIAKKWSKPLNKIAKLDSPNVVRFS